MTTENFELLLFSLLSIELSRVRTTTENFSTLLFILSSI